MLLNLDHPIEDLLARDLLALTEERKQQFIQRAFIYWREKGFPYRMMSAQQIAHNFKKIEKSPSTIISGKRVIGSTIGLDLANSFHPQIWHAARWGHFKSPIDYFNDDESLKKVLEKAMKLWPDRRCWNSYVIRSAFRIYSGGRVSNFRPTVSKAIIEQFSDGGDTVLDFCAGFGGRLLGALALDRNYIGIDPSESQIKANQQMFNAIQHYTKCKVKFIQGCAEEIMPQMETTSANLIFTSPPYFKQEKYNKELNQSYIRYKGYDDWKTNFLEQVIIESHRLLKINGYFIINISNIRGYPLATDFEEFAKKYFTLKDIYELDMTSRPAHRKNSDAYKSEPVYIFQKV
jgi:DNA modification methylase